VQQRVVVEQVFPIPSDPEPHITVGEHTYHDFVDYIYEPSESALMESLIPKHLSIQLWKALLESNAAEQAARRTAMDSATSNANDLISSLQLAYNSARQSSITKEILEVVSGANAMKDN
jgi:F-type H+-transporting ATPase subunit gamma